MEIMKILVIAVFACVCAVLVSQLRPEFSLFIQLTAVLSIILLITGSLSQIFAYLQDFTSTVKINNEYIKLLLKALIIAVSGKVVCDICADTGNRAVATCVDFGCRIAVMLLGLPMLKALTELAAQLIRK